MRKKLLWQGIIIGLVFLITTCAFSNIVKNLTHHNYSQRSSINKDITTLFNGAKEDEYRLGMVLLASAQQGNDRLYYRVLRKMRMVLDKIPDDPKQNSYKSWRLGRILLAADSIGDVETVAYTKAELAQLLQNKFTVKDEFSAWAWGYLAAVDKQEYEKAKPKMLEAASTLSTKYMQMSKTADQNDSQKARSDALWAWVMALQAAANADDVLTYHNILQQIKFMTKKNSIAEALSTGLLRTSASNDYPAWALSITRLAAATMDDKQLYIELGQPLNNAINGAKAAMKLSNEKSAYGATAEATLAQLDAVLAATRMRH